MKSANSKAKDENEQLDISLDISGAITDFLVENFPRKKPQEAEEKFFSPDFDPIMGEIVMNSANSRAKDENEHSDISSAFSGVIMRFLAENYPIDKPQEAEEKFFSPEEEKDSVPPAFSWATNSSLSLFNNLGLRSIAHQLVAGNVDAAIQGVVQLVGDCPTLMHEICEITDHRGRKLKGTLLQLAAMNFDFNPLPPKHMTKSFGAVERLVELGILSGEEIKNQLDAVLGPHSESATRERTDKLKAAVEQLVNDIDVFYIDPYGDWNAMRSQADAIVQTFWAALHPDGVITEGLVFDPQILDWFIERFWGDDDNQGWENRLGGGWSTKSNLLWAVGFGSLQAADSACGLQLHHQGLDQVVQEKKIPSRTEYFSSVTPAFYVGLGSSEYLSVYGGGRKREACILWSDLDQQIFSKCFQTKTAAAQKCMRTGAKPHHRPCCVIL